jgi:hypothetical protein
MKKSARNILIIFLILVGGTGIFLYRTQSRFVLGKPGVKIAHTPIYGEKSNVVGQVSVSLPDSVPGYTVLHPPITDLELQILPPDTTYGRRYYVAQDNFTIQLNTILMGKDRTSLHPPEYCITGQGWQVVGQEEISIPMTRPVPYNLKVQKLTATIGFRAKDGSWEEYRGNFLYWFVADQELTPSRVERMWSMARELLTTGTVQRWAYISYFSYGPPAKEKEMLDRLTRFIQQTLPEFQIPPGTSTEQVAAVK